MESVQVTASIVDTQHQDPYFRNDPDGTGHPSEEMLRGAYCMTIMRLVNGVIEKTRKKYEISIGEAADAIGLPRMLVDIRHEAAHRDLPSIQLLRMASEIALDWLVSYYWEPQEKMIPTQDSRAANLRKEIKRSLREFLKAKREAKSGSSQANGIRSKKQLATSLKKKKQNILRLYSSCSPEVVDVLLEYLQSALEPSNVGNPSKDFQVAHSTENKRTALDDWKSVVVKLSSKKLDFILSLTQAVIDKLEAAQAVNCVKDDNSRSSQGELLSCLLEWLIGRLKKLSSNCEEESLGNKVAKIAKHLPKSTVRGLLQRCLLASAPWNHNVMGSALILKKNISSVL